MVSNILKFKFKLCLLVIKLPVLNNCGAVLFSALVEDLILANYFSFFTFLLLLVLRCALGRCIILVELATHLS